MNLDYFKEQDDFYKGLQILFNALNIPINYIDEKPLKPEDILLKISTSKNKAYKLMDDVYILGMVDDAAFYGEDSKSLNEIKNTAEDYPGIVIFGVTLKQNNGKLPTRTELSEITRAFNQEYKTIPVVVVFRYGKYISLANAERQKYKQEWREGEKAGKVSILRDVEIENPHTGHLKILEELKITRSGKKGINSFEGLYRYWQEVFSVSLLSKKFYKELSNWYFWAIKHVKFPSESMYMNDKNQEYKAQSVIRLLTRLLFVWFIKEKKLIPEELFDLDTLQDKILKKIEPEHFLGQGQDNKESIYYKAILQNLFFATLNCPIKADSIDSRKRGFRLDDKKDNKSQKSDFGVLFLMRYKKHFKNPGAFLEIVNKTVPFLNGGLFECLDIRGEGEKKEDRLYIDGFSENIPKGQDLIVPDYLFFGKEEKVDLSHDLGIKNKGTKEAAVKGLIKILRSYKFTISENTPIEEDVALDPELLGKVFENLLASYNPETKTTARKKTGSFYTPREIVNYMVDESLIAHLKNSVSWDIEEKELDKKLRRLVSFEPVNPFENDTRLSQEIIHSLDNCKILDPACGSGAFPMGILQKMVHILQKVDPDNRYWKELQRKKAKQDSDKAYEIDNKLDRQTLLKDVDEAFDQSINNPDYARKLFLIENCIYGVDIQPIAAQISKLRFFISLVVEQKVNKEKDNFGIRPLPNLETRFVTANTLIGIDKEGDLFHTEEVKKKEAELKAIRHKLFGAKTKATKVKYRKRDEELRNKIADILKKGNLPVESAEQLASWDPYDQNGVSPFFDPEWMFDIKDGFDIVIGNPPYVQIQKFSGQQIQKDWQNEKYKTFVKTGDIYSLFYEKGNMVLRDGGVLAYITSNKWMKANYGKATRKYFLKNINIQQIIDFGDSQIFENATTYTNILIFSKKQNINQVQAWDLSKEYNSDKTLENMLEDNASCENIFNEDSFVIIPTEQAVIKKRIEEIGTPLKEWDISIYRGVLTGYNKAFIINGEKKDELIAIDPKSAEIIKPILRGRDIKRYKAELADLWLINLHNGYRDIPPMNVDNYPAIKNHLNNYWANIEKRYDQGITPYNLRNCAYVEKFEKGKVMWLEMSPISNFTFSNEVLFVLNTAYIMLGDSLKYILAVINSSILSWYFPFISTDVRGNTRCYIKQYVENFPIAKILPENQHSFETLVDCILFAKENDMEPEANTFESVIDGMVYDLYFEEEMKSTNCYITDRISEVVKPFKEDDSDGFKKEYIEKLYTFCRNDKIIFRGLIHRRNIKVVKIINGETK